MNCLKTHKLMIVRRKKRQKRIYNMGFNKLMKKVVKILTLQFFVETLSLFLREIKKNYMAVIKDIHESDKKRNSFFIFIAATLIPIAFLAIFCSIVVFNPL